MTATLDPTAATPPDRTAPAVAIGIGIGAVTIGLAAGTAPLVAVVLVLGGIGAAVLARRPMAATGLLIASFFFDEILSSGGLVTPGKLIGVVAVTAWLVDTIRHRRPIVTVAHLWPLALLSVWLVPSLAVAEDAERGLIIATRYLMFVALFFLVVQAVGGRYRRAVVLGDIAVYAAAAAAVIGLIGFVWGSEFRASGPLGDANDFGFLLASTVPLSVWRRSRWIGSRRWNPFTVTTILIVGATLATFSRGAFVALAVAGAWSVVTKRVPLRQGLAAIAAVLAVAAVGYVTQGDLVNEAVERKTLVAQRNVDTRVDAWGVAFDQFGSAPITGVGPGQFVVRYTDFAPPPSDTGTVITTHNAYLNILAELGLPGLTAFLGYLGLGWWALRRRESDREVDGFRSALAASFLVALVGAFFLTEQFYAPLWLFGALGAADLVREDSPDALGLDGHWRDQADRRPDPDVRAVQVRSTDSISRS